MMAEGGPVEKSAPEAFGLPATGGRCKSFDASFDSVGVGSLTCRLHDDGRYGKDMDILLSRDSAGTWKCTSTVTDTTILPAACV